MRILGPVFVALLLLCVVSAARSDEPDATPVDPMVAAAEAYVQSLSSAERRIAILPFNDPNRRV